MKRQSDLGLRQNLTLSILLGPLRSIIPALLSVFLYPMLLRAGGLELVGTWSVLQLIVLYSGLCACGLPSLVMRKVAAEVEVESVIVKLISIVLGGYLLCGAVLLTPVTLCAEQFWHLIHLPIRPDATPILTMTVLAGVVANVASLYAAVLSGLHRSYMGQMAETAGILSQFIVAATSIVLGQPYLGVAASLLVGKLTVLATVAIATWQLAPAYRRLYPRLNMNHLAALLAQAKGFMWLETGNALAEGMVRALLIIIAGPSELGLYDIANRLPVLIRNSFTYGLLAMFPAITALHAQKNQAVIEQVLRSSLLVTVFLIIAPLGLYVLLAKPLLILWLGDVGAQVSIVTLITTAWWIITAYNIPFYFTIQAVGLENVVARNTWLRILLIVFGSAVFYVVPANALSISCLVLATGLVAEIQLYAEAQHRARLLTVALSRRQDCIVFIGSLALLATAFWLKVNPTVLPAELRHAVAALGAFALIWIMLLTVATGGRPVQVLSGIMRTPAKLADESTPSY